MNKFNLPKGLLSTVSGIVGSSKQQQNEQAKQYATSLRERTNAETLRPLTAEQLAQVAPSVPKDKDVNDSIASIMRKSFEESKMEKTTAVDRINAMYGRAGAARPVAEANSKKSLAALAHPKDKITQKDVLVGRGVLAKEEVEEKDEKKDDKKSPFDWKNTSRQTSDGKTKTGHVKKKTATGTVYTKVDEDAEQVDEMNVADKFALKGPQRMNVPAYLRKKKGEAALKPSDLERKDTLSNPKNTKNMGEEVEQVSELKKSTLASYVGKAAKSAVRLKSMSADMHSHADEKFNDAIQIGRDPERARRDINLGKQTRVMGKELSKAASKRLTNIDKASARLAKEDIDQVDEALRTVSTHKGEGPHHAVVKRDAEWNEYQVHFYKDGKHMGEGPVSHHDEKADAQSTAEHEVKRMNAKAVKEGIELSAEEIARIEEIAKGL